MMALSNRLYTFVILTKAGLPARAVLLKKKQTMHVHVCPSQLQQRTRHDMQFCSRNMNWILCIWNCRRLWIANICQKAFWKPYTEAVNYVLSECFAASNLYLFSSGLLIATTYMHTCSLACSNWIWVDALNLEFIFLFVSK